MKRIKGKNMKTCAWRCVIKKRRRKEKKSPSLFHLRVITTWRQRNCLEWHKNFVQPVFYSYLPYFINQWPASVEISSLFLPHSLIRVLGLHSDRTKGVVKRERVREMERKRDGDVFLCSNGFCGTPLSPCGVPVRGREMERNPLA